MNIDLENYIERWDKISGAKPVNEQECIDGFIDYIKNISDIRDFKFNGDGCYFGKQITVCEGSFFGSPNLKLNFEVAYSENKISVYSANNDGYWVPEYIRLTPTDEKFKELKAELFSILHELFGI